MTQEQLIGLITLAVIIWIVVMCFKHGTNGLWGLLLKILFFPLYIIYFMAKTHRERKKQRKANTIHIFWW